MPSEIDGHDLFGKAFDPKQSMEHKMVPSPFVSSVGSSFFSKDIRDRQIGFWKQEPVPDQHDIGNGGRSGVVSSTQFESFGLVGSKLLECLEMSKTHSLVDQKIKPNFEKHIIGPDRSAMLAATSWRTPDQNLGARLNFSVRSASWFAEANKDADRSHYENGLFSSSFSEVFDKKLRLSTPGFAFPHSIDATSNLEDDENFESLKEIEARTIGNLLPDDDDLFSGVTDGIDGGTRISSGDDMEDYDFFSSVGGFELESDNGLSCNGTIEGSDHLGRIPNAQLSNGLYAGEHPFGEHPSRTLFVRNINSNVEDAELRALFEKYGDIRVLYTACKHRGFVMISYYDIRAARNAMRALQNKPLRNRKLDIHFSIPKDNPSEKDLNQGTLVVFNLDSSVSNDDLRQIFGDYGEIKEIRETPHKRHHKFIEFYDVRAADAALKALNRSDIAGKKIKLEPSRPGGARRLMQPLSNESELEEGGSLHQLAGCLTSSPPSCCIVQSSSMPTNCSGTGASLGLNSSNRPPLSPFLDVMIPGISSAPAPASGLSPPIGVASVGNHVCRSSLGESHRPFGQVTTGLQSIPAFHPHSLPEFSCAGNNFVYNSPGAMRSLTTNNNVRYTEEIDARQMQRFGADGFHSHSFDINEGVHGFTGNGSCPLHGHHMMIGTPNSYSQIPNPMSWSNSPSLVNGIHNQFHGFPRVQAHLMHPHHVGSAPVVDPSVWERRHPFSVDGNEVMSFLPGSLGNMGFTGSPGLHPMEFAPPAMFSHVAGNGLDASLSASKVGGPSPQHRCHMFSSRSGLISAPATFDGVNERGRGRRTDSNNQMDNKKQYELDLDRILRGEDTRTTLMIKNIPNKYTSKMLLAAIDENHKGTYDFIYLPIDFKNKCNVGYAFINMVNSQQIIPFYEAFNGKKWEKFNSEKVASLAYARIQGKSALIAHFQNSSLMNEDKRCRPILFHSDGPNAGDQEPFPMGVNIRARAGKNRSTGNEENHQGSLSMSILGEDSSNGTDSSSGSAKDGE